MSQLGQSGKAQIEQMFSGLCLKADASARDERVIGAANCRRCWPLTRKKFFAALMHKLPRQSKDPARKFLSRLSSWLFIS